MLSQSVAQNFAVVWERSAQQAAERIKTGLKPDIVLIDLDFPGQNKQQICRAIIDAAPTVPIVVISPRRDEYLSVEVGRYGAQDYLVKGEYDGPLLVRTLRYAKTHKSIEESLAREEELLNSLLSNSPDFIYFKDDRSRFIRINQSLADLLDLSDPKEAVGKTDADYYSPEHAEKALADERHIMETGEPMVAENEKVEFRRGGSFWANSTKLPLRDRQGRIVGTMGISRDLTEQRNIEEILATEQLLLRSILDALPDNVFVKDESGNYFESNIAHTRDLGCEDPEEVVGKNAYDFFESAVAKEYHESDMQVMDSGEPILNKEEKRKDKDGNSRWILTSKVPFFSPETGHCGLIGISRDITAQKKAEIQLRDAIQSLRETQKQLIEAEKFKSIARLTSGIAHEVKNPLGVVLMGLEYFKKKESSLSDPKMTELLNDMGEAASRANEVINELLNFSAPESEEFEPVDINRMIEQAIVLTRPHLREGNLSIELEAGDGLPSVQGLEKKLCQVLVNLFLNSIHAMPEGGKITVRTGTDTVKASGENYSGAIAETFRTGDRLVRIQVDDMGKGIPKEKLAEVFNPFVTSDESTDGTGLGLTVSKNIIDMHSGMIHLKNLPEGGIRAEILLPVKDKES